MDFDYLDYMIIDMYNEGYSIKKIVDDVFRYSKRHIPKNSSFSNYPIALEKPYSRLDCYNYVSRMILNYNRTRSV